MNKISEQVLRRLEVLAKTGDLLSTLQVREVMALSRQALHRLTFCDDFPTQTHISRQWWVHPQALLEFAHRWNALCDGIPLYEVAALIRSTPHTTRRLLRAADFPKALGQLNGRDRWERAAVVTWHRARGGGASLPPGADVGTPRGPRKKKPPKLKAVAGGKAGRR